jgi:phosphate transport system substrate-binding protein
MAVVALAVGAVCTAPTVAQERVVLRGAGATFPYPLYLEWFDLYGNLRPGVVVDYHPVGSGAGIEAVVTGGAAFGASDAFLTDDDLRRAGVDLVHVPTCLGAVAVTYNLPGLPELRFTADLLADLFSGRIRRWNDRRIAAVNPGLRFPDTPITVVHRHDASGTTMLFTDFLSKTSTAWRDGIGHGTTVEWPVGVAADGNDGVVARVLETPGSIAYVEHNHAVRADLPVGAIRNREAYYIKPTLDTMTAAARVPLADDCRVLVTDTTAPEGYPITGFTFIVVRRDLASADLTRSDAETLAAFLWWAVHDGQVFTEELAYAPLPVNAVVCAERAIRALQWRGSTVLDVP